MSERGEGQLRTSAKQGDQGGGEGANGQGGSVTVPLTSPVGDTDYYQKRTFGHEKTKATWYTYVHA